MKISFSFLQKWCEINEKIQESFVMKSKMNGKGPYLHFERSFLLRSVPLKNFEIFLDNYSSSGTGSDSDFITDRIKRNTSKIPQIQSILEILNFKSILDFAL